MAHIGQAVTFSVVFTHITSGVETDPTVVEFWLRENVIGTESYWVYNASHVEGTHYPTGGNPIVRATAGNYSVVWVTRNPERHVGFWEGSGNSADQASQTTVFVRHSDIEEVDGV